MGSHKLDEFFRKKLEGQVDPVFNDDHWQDARRMLQQGSGRGRRVIGLMSILLLLVVLSVLLNGHLRSKSEGTQQGPMADLLLVDERSYSASPKQTSPKGSTTALGTRAVIEQDIGGDRGADLANTSETLPGTRELASVMDGQESNQLVASVGDGESPKQHSLSSDQQGVMSVSAPQFSQSTHVDLSDHRLTTHRFLGIKRLSLQRIADVSQPLKRPEEPLIINSSLVAAAPIEAERYPRRFGMLGAVEVSQSPEDESILRAISLGLGIDRFLSHRWYMGIRPMLHMKTGQGGFAKFQSSVSYSFESSETTYGLQAESLLFGRIPLCLGYTDLRHSLEMGIAPEYLIAARGQLEEIELADDQYKTVKVLSKGWIETGEIKKINARIYAGYRFALIKEMQIGIDAHYQLGKLYPGLPSQQAKDLESRWSLGLSALYYLK